MPQITVPTKVTGEQLSATEFNSVVAAHNTNDTKLAGIATGATANSADAVLLARANHTGTQTADSIVDGTTNKAYTAAEKTKLSGVAVNATANDTDINLKARSNHSGTQTADTIIDGTTNKVLSAANLTKLNGIATAATANSTDAVLLARANHTGTQSADTLTDGTTNKAFLATERTKLSGIATAATANSTDVALRDRSTHTGVQAQSTITGLTASFAAKADLVAGIVPENQLPPFNLVDAVDNTQFDEITQGGVQKISIKPSILSSGGSSFSQVDYFRSKNLQLWNWMNDTSIRPVLGATNSITGTASSQTYSSSNGQWYAKKARWGIESAATAGALASVRQGSWQVNLGDGFNFTMRYMIGDPVSVTDARNFVGFTSLNVDIAIGSADPSTITNIIGFGSDSTDTNLQFMYNDATGTATKVDLGVNFPANTRFADIYEVSMVVTAGAVAWKCMRYNASTGAFVAEVSGTVAAAAAKLPASNQKLMTIAVRSNAATAAMVRLIHFTMILEWQSI